MSGRYLLDSNIIIALFADEVAIKDSLAKAEEVFVPSIAIGELYFGARKSVRTGDNLARIDEFAANNVVLGCDTGRGDVVENLHYTNRRWGQASVMLTFALPFSSAEWDSNQGV